MLGFSAILPHMAGRVDIARRGIVRAIGSTERFFDRLKLAYKWRFNRFFDLRIVAYCGFGSAQHVWLKGRVLDDPAPRTGRHDSVWHNVRTTIRRVETDEVPGATVRICFHDEKVELETDEDGYFEAMLDAPPMIDGERWHEVRLELLRPRLPSGDPVEATGAVVIPTRDAEFGVISDLDDTVVRSGAYNRLQMGRIVLLNSANTRTPFPGVASFYRALLAGSDGTSSNPIFYVSSSPWNMYDLFEDFMEAHEIPAGPILLRDFGFSEERLLSGSHRSHKLERVERIMDMYPDLSFVLIGDSGQRDPEIYAELVRIRPDRVRAIFVRDVSPPDRDAQVHAIADEVEALGVPMALVQDTQDAARRAADLGLIARSALPGIAQHRRTTSELSLPFRLLERLFG